MIAFLGVILIFCIVFPLFWMSIIWLISRMGWANLATYYATPHSVSGEKRMMRSMRIGRGLSITPANYSACLNFHLSETDLYLEPLWIFKFGHETLKIPLSDIHFIGETSWFGMGEVARLDRASDINLVFMKRDVDWIKSRQTA